MAEQARIESERTNPLTDLYAYVVQIGEGDKAIEGVLRRKITDGTQPLVGDDPFFMGQLLPVAQEAIRGMADVRSLKLVRFNRAEEKLLYALVRTGPLDVEVTRHDDTSPYDDPEVKAALKSGRSPRDIFLMDCPQCGGASYYNRGSHFTCRFCGGGYRCVTEEESLPGEGACIVLGDEYTLADFEDGYDDAVAEDQDDQ